MNVNMLKGRIRGCGMSQMEVAEKIGISLSRFNAKLNERGAAFTLHEVQALSKLLLLDKSDFCKIFME